MCGFVSEVPVCHAQSFSANCSGKAQTTLESKLSYCGRSPQKASQKKNQVSSVTEC